MVNLAQIRLDMEEKLAIDSQIHSVEVIADSLDDCLADAAVQLNSKVKLLEYEVIEKGYKGFIGLMKKPWKIRVYENPDLVQHKKEDIFDKMDMESEFATENMVIDKDGESFVHYFGANVCIKITLPLGNGSKINEKSLLSELNILDIQGLDTNKVKELVKSGTDGKYVAIGTYNHMQVGDATLAVDISEDEMKATISVTPPAPGGSEISFDQIVNSLKIQGVCAGIDEEKISNFVDNPQYNIPYEVASAILPVDGRDAYMAYDFETDMSKFQLKENASGQVNWKELKLIQNVTAGQRLAQKMQAQRGKGGKTIRGRYLEAKNGKDINISLGENVRLDRDGCTVIAEKNGHVILVGGKITVEEVYEVNGVGIKSGNIDFQGSVVCKGSVEDGFNIKAAGNIEIYGSVGNCQIEAGGDIIISQGVMGKDEGKITAGKSLWAKFIQNVTVKSGEHVSVNDGIVNCNVTAMKKIIVNGKRAAIMGGHVFATEEISAKNIGSTSGQETNVEVGADPEATHRLHELQALQTDIVKELDKIDPDIQNLENQKNVRRQMPKDKEEKLQKLISQHNELTSQNDEYIKEIEEIQSRLRELKVVGRINVSGTVYPGTKVRIRDEMDEVKTEVKAVTFYLEKSFIRRGKYDQSQVTENVETPSGYK